MEDYQVGTMGSGKFNLITQHFYFINLKQYVKSSVLRSFLKVTNVHYNRLTLPQQTFLSH